MTDRPLLEAEEATGGHAIVDVPDLDAALALAASFPVPDGKVDPAVAGEGHAEEPAQHQAQDGGAGRDEEAGAGWIARGLLKASDARTPPTKAPTPPRTGTE